MGRVPRFVLLSIFCFSAIVGLGSRQNLPQTDNDHTEWIASALRSIQVIKVGMTRADLMKVFTTEGGMYFQNATASQRAYVYRKCPYIKVDVKLAISSPYEELPTDKITEISRPYLEWSVMD